MEICGFWDGSCRVLVCGAGMCVKKKSRVPSGIPSMGRVNVCRVAKVWMMKFGVAR